VRAIPANDRWSFKETTADASSAYAAANPFTGRASWDCSTGPNNQDFRPGSYGRVYLDHADGNAVFASYGRAMHVVENENSVDVYLFPIRDLDWWGAVQRTVSVTRTSRGAAVTATKQAEISIPALAQLTLVDAQSQRAIIRAGDSVTATFDDGPPGTTRPVTLSMNAIAPILGTPDLDTNSLAGVGPNGWNGAATLNNSPFAKADAAAR
jgi:hypothetical protein